MMAEAGENNSPTETAFVLRTRVCLFCQFWTTGKGLIYSFSYVSGNMTAGYKLVDWLQTSNQS